MLWGVSYHGNLISCNHIWILLPENMAAVSDKHGKRFHKDISQIEERYIGKWSPYKLADYCWRLIR
jgi:hypothetical protein